MMLRESLSNVGHLITSPNGHVLTIERRRLNRLLVCSKSNRLRPLRQPAPPAESPSTNTSFVESGEKLGSIIAVLPSPQAPGKLPLRSTGDAPVVCGVCQIE